MKSRVIVKTKTTSTDKYKDEGLVQLAVWVPPEIRDNVRALARARGQKISQVIIDRFKEVQVQVKRVGGRTVVTSDDPLESED